VVCADHAPGAAFFTLELKETREEMHKSKLVAAVIDCQVDDLADAARFWSAALGREVKEPETVSKEKYAVLGDGDEDLILLLQKVPHPSRVHLDIETDDIEAEVQRLEALGAQRVEKINTWWVMQAPTGHRFCVVRPQRAGKMPYDATRWP
jgi:predicted enzyme related to lactoylglutathione lyase